MSATPQERVLAFVCNWAYYAPAEQAELERMGHVALPLVQERVVERDRGARGDLARELRRDQRLPTGTGGGANRQRADRMASRAQRQNVKRARPRGRHRLLRGLAPSAPHRTLGELQPRRVALGLRRA